MSVEANQSLYGMMASNTAAITTLTDVMIASQPKDKIGEAAAFGGGTEGFTGTFFKSMSTQMKGFSKSMGRMFASALGPMAFFGGAISAFLEPMEMIIEPITTIGEIFGTMLYPILEPIADALYKVMPYIEIVVEYLTPFAAGLFNVISPIGILIDKGETLSIVLEEVGIWFRSLGDSIADGWSSVTTWFAHYHNQF